MNKTMRRSQGTIENKYKKLTEMIIYFLGKK